MGDADNASLLAACYDEARRIARLVIARDGAGRQLQATELLNEAALRLIGGGDVKVEGEAHMLALIARTMRRVLIDEARKGAAAKRQAPVFVTAWPDDPAEALIGIGDLDRALEALSAVSPEHAQVVELRFMLGLTVEETSAASGIPERTVKRRWQAARAWLLDHLNGDTVRQLA